jgi:hypothetical protein
MTSSPSERQLVLISAGTAARRQAMSARARELASSVNWPRLSEELRLRKLLPALGPRIIELADGGASKDFAESVEQVRTAAHRQGVFVQLVATRVMNALAEAGIRCTPLKGPLLSEAIYGDPGRRLSSDIDLLVAAEQLRPAVAVVRGLGYAEPSDHVHDGGLPLLHFALLHERGELPPVELHWRVHWYERSFARERLLAPATSSQGGWRPAPVDELAALLLFYARDGFVDLRLASDVGAWWDVYGEQLAHDALDDLIGAYPELTRALCVAATVAERLVGLPATRIVEGSPGRGLRSRMAGRLANPNPRTSASQLYADMGLIDGLLSPSGGLGAFVRRQLLPSRKLPDDPPRPLVKRWTSTPPGRSAGILARYALTTTRLLRTPETPG